MIDAAGLAHEQNGKVERHGHFFEELLNDVLAEIQPQSENEWLQCVSEVQEAKNSLLSVSGVSPCQVVFGRNPEVPGDLLQDQPDLVANSAIINDPDASLAARVRAVSRSKVLAYNDKVNLRTALDTRPRVLRQYSPGDMVAVWRGIKHGGFKKSHFRWRPGICMGVVRGNYWIALPGVVVKASPEQMREASREERNAWRLVEHNLRSAVIDFDNLQATTYADITREERPPVAPEEPAPTELDHENEPSSSSSAPMPTPIIVFPPSAPPGIQQL